MDLTQEKGLENFEIFRKSIEMIYGKNYFIEYNKQSSLKIHLYFDEFTIKNSSNNTHQIKDLFVVIRFDYSNEKYELDYGLRGYRTFITQSEANAHYCHSHLSGVGTFCLGSGPLNKFMEANGCSLTFSSENIDLFDEMLLMIFHYVRWESKEGTPHKYMDRIVESKNDSEYIKIENQFLATQNTKTKSIGREFLADLFNASTAIQLKENKFLLKFDTDILLNLNVSNDEGNALYLYKGNDGNLYSKATRSRSRNINAIDLMRGCHLPSFPITLESGKIISKLSVNTSEGEQNIKFTKMINKQFLSNVIKNIEYTLKYK